MAQSIARRLIYQRAKESTNRQVDIDITEFAEVKNGKLYWKNTSQRMSSRWTNAILQALGLDNLEEIEARLEDHDTVTFTVPSEKKGVSNAIGSWFEYCYWKALTDYAKNDPDIKSVEAIASKKFLARGKSGSFIEVALSEADRGIIKDTAEQAALRTINKAKRSLPKEATLVIEAVAGGNAAGDILIEALNGKERTPIPRLMPWVELKYYKGENITFSTLSDKNYGQTFSKYLFNNKTKYWRLDDSTEVWLSKIQNSGLQDYLRYGLHPRGTVEPKEIFTYLLQKGGYKQDLSKKSMIVVNSTDDGKITFTASLKTLRDRAFQRDISIKDRSTIFEGYNEEGHLVNLASLAFANPSQLERESVLSSHQTPGEGPDWNTSFRFILTKAFYG